jgi:hypothetical protein
MATQPQLDAAFTAARAWINQEAGFYAGMIPDADIQKLCQVVLAAAEQTNLSQAKGTPIMNQDQLGGIVRAVVPPLVTWLVTKNIIPAGSADLVISAAVAIAAAAWSVVSNKTGKVIGGK